jgi:hypothetical protein
LASQLIGKELESPSGIGPFSVVTFDRISARRGESVMHQAIASPHTPERRGSHFVGGILGTVLHDSIASPKVVQQEIAEGMDDLVPEGIRNNEGTSVQRCSGRDSRDGSNVTGGATDLKEDLLTGLRVGSCEQSGVDRRSLRSSHERGKLVDVVFIVLGIGGCLTHGGGVGRVEPARDALFVQVGVSSERKQN